MLRRFHWLPLLLVALGLLASLVTLFARYRAESRSRAVALVVDYTQVRGLAAATGVPFGEACARLRSAGITGAAVTEESLADLQASGLLTVTVRPAPGCRPGCRPGCPLGGTRGVREFWLEAADPALAARIALHAGRYLRATALPPAAGDRVALPAAGGAPVLFVPGRFEDIRTCPTGLDAGEVEDVRRAGWDLVARLSNSLGVTAETVRWSLEQARAAGAGTIIFAGEEVLGFRGLLDETAAAFRDLGLLYGDVELGKQRGGERLARLLVDRLVRVHSISAAEMPRLTPREAIERYVRAASERNIRLNYVRLPGTPGPQTFEEAEEYVRGLALGLVAARFGLAAPVPFGRVWPEGLPGRLPGAATALGIGGAAALLAAGLVPLTSGAQAGLALLFSGGSALLALTGISLALQLLALAAAVVFPTLGFVLLPQPLGAFVDHRHAAVRERGEAVVPAVAEFAVLSAVTLAGAGMVAAMLSEMPYLVKVQAFAGIKLATVAPLFLVGWIYLTGMSGLYPTWADERREMERRLRALLSEPLRVWHTAAFAVGLVALALLLARSGNDPGIGISDLELRFRALLDRLLGVRPRTKEFLIGHPALVLALALAAVPAARGAALPLLLVGIIGQVGMLNSFCHLHSPLKITVIRTVNGLWIGALLGVLLVLVWGAVSRGALTRGAARRKR